MWPKLSQLLSQIDDKILRLVISITNLHHKILKITSFCHAKACYFISVPENMST